MNTDESSAQTEKPAPVLNTTPPQEARPDTRPSNPLKIPPTALALHACLDAKYKKLPLETIAENLAEAIEMPGARRTSLNRQFHVLDALFSVVLTDTPKDMQHLPLLNLALRAQRQCQITSASITTTKKIDKQTDSADDPFSSFMKMKF